MKTLNCSEDWTTLVRTPLLSALCAISLGMVESMAPRALAEETQGSEPMAADNVFAWGAREVGQLGDGSHWLPRRSHMEDAVAVVAGGNSSLAVRSDGTLWAWGERIPSGGMASTPVHVSELTEAVWTNLNGQAFSAWVCEGGVGHLLETGWDLEAATGLPLLVGVSAGRFHSLAVRPDGTVWAWGRNSLGQLGDGRLLSDEEYIYYRATPVQVGNLTEVVAVSAGEEHSLALRSNGTVWAWGANYDGRLGDGTFLGDGHESDIPYRATPVRVGNLTDVVAVSAGEMHSLALRSDGTLWAWGQNFEGGLSDPTPRQFSELTDVVAVSSGEGHSLMLRSDGTVWGWGRNWDGQLGDGTTTDSTTPVQVSNLTCVVAVSAGQKHSLALRSDGTVWAWGANYDGGDGTFDGHWSDIPYRATPVQVPNLTDAVAVSAGGGHSLALRSDGTVWAWGLNGSGQGGDGSTTKTRMTPAQVSGLTDAVAVSAGSLHSLASRSDGAVWAWGWNEDGQLGDGTTTTRTSPVQVSGLTDAVAVSAGSLHSLALRSDGTVGGWGANNDGRLGDGTTTDRTTPVQVGNLTDAVAVSAGNAHSLALRSDGAVWAWGRNGNGRLGDGTTTGRTTPVQVLNLTDAVAVSAGGGHSLALRSDGTVWAWGWNGNGELGDGTTTTRTTPVQVSNLTDAVAVSAGESYSLALRSDGTVWAWGWNSNGKLGDGTTTTRTTPVQVLNLTDAVAVSAGGGHSLALVSSALIPPQLRWNEPADVIYGTPLGADQLNATASVPGTLSYSVGGKPAQGAVLPAGQHIVELEFTPAGENNIKVVTYVSVKVTPASLVIVADDQGKLFGSPNPPFTVSYIGFVNEDTPESLLTEPAVYTEADDESIIGLYAIIVDGATAANYDITFVNGTLTIFGSPIISAISPDWTIAGADGFTMLVEGPFFASDALVLWAGIPLTELGRSDTQLEVSVPNEAVAFTPDVTAIPVTVLHFDEFESIPVLFTIVREDVTTFDSAYVPPGDEPVTVSTLTETESGAAVTATVTNTGGDPISVTVATYQDDPAPTESTFDSGGGYVDLQIVGADEHDTALVSFYYPTWISDELEESLQLLYWQVDGSPEGGTWTQVLSTGYVPPVKELRTTNPDGTISGGRFIVEFSATSQPAITELGGTFFAMVDSTPIIDQIDGPSGPWVIGSEIGVSIQFRAIGTPATQWIRFDWGDGHLTEGSPSVAGNASALHTYLAPGVYPVTVTVVDMMNIAATERFRYVVIYDPEGGFVTGGGWIWSPEGAFHPGLEDFADVTGRATFGFVSRYQRGASVPTGNTEFQFRAGALNFKSTEYQWLVIPGARAQYKGSGTINGQGDYGFMLTAVDGQVSGGGGEDRFRLKIWDETSGTIIYDNQHGADDNGELQDHTVIGGGSIVIHSPPPGQGKK